jgi:hypothetical protein
VHRRTQALILRPCAFPGSKAYLETGADIPKQVAGRFGLGVTEPDTPAGDFQPVITRVYSIHRKQRHDIG